MTEPRSAFVLGARNLGGSIAGDLIEHGWRVASVARSAESLDRVRALGAMPLAADATDPDDLAQALQAATVANGAPSLFVNAVSASRSTGGPWGGGPVTDAGIEGIRQWCTPVAEQCAIFLQLAARSLRASGGGTIVQVTGGSARRAMPGRGAWAAGAAATRALVHAAAQELREEDIHVALLIVDATIESPKTAERAAAMPARALIRESDVAAAVRYLASQEVRGLTHELVVTPAGDRWLP
jgi:NADP-dependent 3-hydroxy acid dehydrogenase YdfG